MKKRVFSVFLALVMVLCLAPAASLAANGAETAKSIMLGTSGMAMNDIIYYGVYNDDITNYNVPWYVINLNKTNKTGFMLSKYTLGTSVFADGYDNEGVYYDSSELKSKMETLYTNVFTSAEKAGITTTDVNYRLDAADITVNNAHVFPLSVSEAWSLRGDILKTRAIEDTDNPDNFVVWWLGNSDDGFLYSVVDAEGTIHERYLEYTGGELGVRPAFNLNLNSVLFTSAAKNGKSAGNGLSAVESSAVNV